MSGKKYKDQNKYEKKLHIGEGYFNALFTPTVNQYDVFDGNVTNNFPHWNKDTIKSTLEEIREINFKAPEKYGDVLMSFVVMADAFTKDNFNSIAQEMHGGSTVPEGFPAEGTGLIFYFENVLSHDSRANTMAPFKLVPQARRNVKKMIDDNNEAAIESKLSACFQMLYKQAANGALITNDQVNSSIKHLCSLVDALKEKNIDPISLGITQHQLEMTEVFRIRREIGLRTSELETELEECGKRLVETNGTDPSVDPRKNPALMDKYYEMLALHSISLNIMRDIKIMQDAYKFLPEDEKEDALTKRGMSSNERIIKENLQLEIAKAKLAVKAYSKNVISKNLSLEQCRTTMSNVAQKDTYNRVGLPSLEEYDRVYADMHLEFVENALKAEGLPETGFKALNDSVAELKAARTKPYAEMTVTEKRTFREKYIKYSNVIHAVTNSTLDYDNPVADEAISKLTKIDEILYSVVRNERLDLLYGVHPEKMKWGVSKDKHVAHLFIGNEKDMIELDNMKPKTNDLGEVSQEDAYKTLSDAKTEQFFRQIAMKSAEEYQKYGKDPDFGKICTNIKSYVLATGRADQQRAIVDVYKSIDAFLKKNEAKKENDWNIRNKCVEAQNFKEALLEFNNGLLHIPEEEKARLDSIKPKEPADASLGHIGMWSKVDGPLFPHEPSPNDIKQGKINDCFMMSSLIKMADSKPEKIRENIVDNNDGTVTVRFFKKGRDEQKKPIKKPVYVKVNKTVNKTLFGQNTYSSSSNWVQMVEKAYAVFMTDHYAYGGNPNDKGFQRLDRGTSQMFMDAFDDTDFYVSHEAGFGYNNPFDKDRYKFDNPKPQEYNDYENELFGILSRSNQGDVITVGSKVTDNPALEKYITSVGIHTKHAYALLGTFEKEVNGQMKKFVQLQDPFASFRTGYDNNGNLKDNSALISGTFNAGVPNMGKFNMELSDFMRTFNSFSGLSEKNYTDYSDMQFRHLQNSKQKVNEVPNQVNEQPAPKEQEQGGFADDFDIIDNPVTEVKQPQADKPEVKKPESTLDIKLAEMRDKLNDIIKSGENEAVSVEKNAEAKQIIAEAIACYTIQDIIGKFGANMDEVQIKDLQSEKMLADSTKDVVNSRAFTEFLKGGNERFSKFLETGAAEDFKPLYNSFTDCVKQIANKDLQAQQEKAAKKNDNNVEVVEEKPEKNVMALH